MRRLLDRGSDFDGVFVASAQMASGAMGVLRERGIRVPEDVGMVTFDNDYFAQSAQPPLTTVEQPTVDVGQEDGVGAAAPHRWRERRHRHDDADRDHRAHLRLTAHPSPTP